MNTNAIRSDIFRFLRIRLFLFITLFLSLATHNLLAQYKINGKIQFLRFSQINRVYQAVNSFPTREYTRTLIPLSETSIKDAMGNQWLDIAFGEVSPVFQIFSAEYDFSNIRICAHAYDDRYAALDPQIRATLNVTPAKEQFENSVTTDKSGSFQLEISNGDFTWVTVSANGGTIKSATCGSEKKPSLLEEVKGSTYKVYHNDFLHHGDFRTYPVNITLYVTLDGELLNLQKRVDEFTLQLPSLSLSEILKHLDELIDNNTSFAVRFPKSCSAVRDSILSIAQRNILARADSVFNEKKFESALALYIDLARLSPTSPNSKVYASKKELTLVALSKQRTDDSLRAYCDSLITTADTLPNKSKSIQFLESKRKALASTNPYWQKIEERIQLLKSDMATEKEQADFNHQKQADLSALKKFKVDLDITLLDLFSNPFALKGKYIAISCIVVKFETPTSAIMESDKRFYADFKVTPPKKFAMLNLIVKVKGVTTLVNTFGTPVKVPYVDVVHILNMAPEN